MRVWVPSRSGNAQLRSDGLGLVFVNCDKDAVGNWLKLHFVGCRSSRRCVEYGRALSIKVDQVRDLYRWCVPAELEDALDGCAHDFASRVTSALLASFGGTLQHAVVLQDSSELAIGTRTDVQGSTASRGWVGRGRLWEWHRGCQVAVGGPMRGERVTASTSGSDAMTQLHKCVCGPQLPGLRWIQKSLQS
ncbi:hypothetical protein K437DRAFT_10562 [Tilletiaria anomala UBC 951]|uniref:Uncharacterized protein n=1 Tax=Tilletiaria anomala (strain ATCC 24038 / CBS 436.72 / UBC 951) TaxID=1037660 RepID=A0A066VCQ8_TILAU|nr:uncharacterized protein K437DRAFT_10562 [Tilletiaria anomala UBC 951]KDN39532.1 hypothetical protein K437DRAFT_10562 [Tilletiaria anomala UBC 951]